MNTESNKFDWHPYEKVEKHFNAKVLLFLCTKSEEVMIRVWLFYFIMKEYRKPQQILVHLPFGL